MNEYDSRIRAGDVVEVNYEVGTCDDCHAFRNYDQAILVRVNVMRRIAELEAEVERLASLADRLANLLDGADCLLAGDEEQWQKAYNESFFHNDIAEALTAYRSARLQSSVSEKRAIVAPDRPEPSKHSVGRKAGSAVRSGTDDAIAGRIRWVVTCAAH